MKTAGILRRLLIATSLAGPLVLASEPLPSGIYEITVETNMPHLDENLRYATTHETRCLSQQDLSTAFPVLQHASLKDCRLDPERRDDHEAFYRLVCAGGHGTTGSAVWTLGPNRVSGTLQVKLGGKNMTFSQRWTAIPMGQCEVP